MPERGELHGVVKKYVSSEQGHQVETYSIPSTDRDNVIYDPKAWRRHLPFIENEVDVFVPSPPMEASYAKYYSGELAIVRFPIEHFQDVRAAYSNISPDWAEALAEVNKNNPSDDIDPRLPSSQDPEGYINYLDKLMRGVNEGGKSHMIMIWGADLAEVDGGKSTADGVILGGGGQTLNLMNSLEVHLESNPLAALQELNGLFRSDAAVTPSKPNPIGHPRRVNFNNGQPMAL